MAGYAEVKESRKVKVSTEGRHLHHHWDKHEQMQLLYQATSALLEAVKTHAVIHLQTKRTQQSPWRSLIEQKMENKFRMAQKWCKFQTLCSLG